MKAVLLDGFGGPEVLKIAETHKPMPSEEQVLIKVAATSVNRPDIVQREGNYPPPKGDSEIPGLEVAGIIEEVGPGVTAYKCGDRVMSLVGGGGYAQYAVAYAGHLIPIPDTMSFESAACVCESYITAFLNIFMIGGFKDGQVVLAHGGGGGVNTAAIQLCRKLAPNGRILVTASPGKIERVRKLGVDLVINYQEEDFAEEVRAFTGKKGADVILDHIGANYLAPNMKALAVGGTLVIIGIMSGAKAELNLALMMVKRQRIIGSVLRSRSVQEKQEIVAQFTRTVMPVFSDGSIEPVIYRTYPLDDVAEAHRTMEQSKHFGKIVLTLD
ncbi:MAG: NAD(P)H-quinone oxidoreductase [Gammaproteobacteria bacterium]|nr:NAD(P)H-quinone oxidoreductase [Gammaproteobacteria bacterium]MDH3560119.1 NAD(P)H-quinone oxidoreductase [Gammaproteobacteria bacterium]